MVWYPVSPHGDRNWPVCAALSEVNQRNIYNFVCSLLDSIVLNQEISSGCMKPQVFSLFLFHKPTLLIVLACGKNNKLEDNGAETAL